MKKQAAITRAEGAQPVRHPAGRGPQRKPPSATPTRASAWPPPKPRRRSWSPDAIRRRQRQRHQLFPVAQKYVEAFAILASHRLAPRRVDHAGRDGRPGRHAVGHQGAGARRQADGAPAFRRRNDRAAVTASGAASCNRRSTLEAESAFRHCSTLRRPRLLVLACARRGGPAGSRSRVRSGVAVLAGCVRGRGRCISCSACIVGALGEVAIFAALTTLITTFLARRYLVHAPQGPSRHQRSEPAAGGQEGPDHGRLRERATAAPTSATPNGKPMGKRRGSASRFAG